MKLDSRQCSDATPQGNRWIAANDAKSRGRTLTVNDRDDVLQQLIDRVEIGAPVKAPQEQDALGIARAPGRAEIVGVDAVVDDVNLRDAEVTPKQRGILVTDRDGPIGL